MPAPELAMLLLGSVVLWAASFVVTPVIGALGRYQLAVTLSAILIVVPLSFTGLAAAVAQSSATPVAVAAASGFAAGVTLSAVFAFAALAISSSAALEQPVQTSRR